MAQSQLTIDDLDSLVKSLRYAQTLVDTAESGASISYDFLKSYDYYGAVSFSISSETKIVAPAITLTNYDANAFFQYNEDEMSGLFFREADMISATVRIIEQSEGSNYSLLTNEKIDELSIVKDGSIDAEELSYDPTIVFDENTDLNTLVPISFLAQHHHKLTDTLNVNSLEWDFRVSFGSGEIQKPINEDKFIINNIFIHNGIDALNILSPFSTFSASILEQYIGSDMLISPHTVLSDDLMENSNLATLEKIDAVISKKAGDYIDLSLQEQYTDTELKKMIDDFMLNSQSSPIYTGQDAFLTEGQAIMLVEYIYRKVTGIKKATIQI